MKYAMEKGRDYIGVGVGAVIVNQAGQIFLAKRGRQAKNEVGKWECPGGSVELGETLHDTLVREMREEYDVSIEVVDLIDVCDHILRDEGQHWVSPSFLCRITEGTPRIVEKEKCDEIGWFAIDEAERMDLSVATRHNLKGLRRRYPDGRIPASPS